jgi:hypothetical protein
VSNAAFSRFYYYLTVDDRCGDLMHDLIHSDQTLTHVDIARKTGKETPQDAAKLATAPQCGFGTDWGAFLAAWTTEWERTGDTQWRDRILAGMNSIARMKRGWFAGGAPMDLKTGAFLGDGDTVNVSHLSGVFGVFEIHMELMKLVDVPDYKKAWLDYCKYYNAPADVITAFLGENPKDRSLRDAHSRYTAYAARELNDPALAERAWQELLQGEGRGTNLQPHTTHIAGSAVLHPVDEDPEISTNGAAQWGLAAVADLALVGDKLETLGAKYVRA